MPGLFEQFPHTNLHELNLDWIIDMINQFKEELEGSAVLSVNGQTGHVTLYESENVVFPALPEGVDQWRLVRMMNGQNIGILFYDGNVYLQRGNTNLRLLTRDDIPADAGVLSWNGQTGIVIATGENIIRSEDNPVSIDQALTTETTERTNQDNTFRNQINIINHYLADTPQYASQMKMSMSDTTTVENAINTLNNNLQIKQFLIPATVTHTIDSVSALNSALENSSMNTLAINAADRQTLYNIRLIPTTDAGMWNVRKLSSGYIFMEYTTYTGRKYFTSVNNGTLDSWHEVTATVIQ